MIKRIDHIGIAVRDLKRSLLHWEKHLGLYNRGIEELEAGGVICAHLKPEDGPELELLTPWDESSTVAKFLARHGEGIHHICLEVDNIFSSIKEFKDQGIECTRREPNRGAGGDLVVFIHPRHFNGVLVELKEKNKQRVDKKRGKDFPAG